MGNQTFQVLFGPDFDTAKYCPSGVSVDVLNELRDYTQGCFQYKHGFPELYSNYGNREQPIRLNEMPSHGIAIKSLHELMGLAADAPGPTANCSFVFENRTFGWKITYGQ